MQTQTHARPCTHEMTRCCANTHSHARMHARYRRDACLYTKARRQEKAKINTHSAHHRSLSTYPVQAHSATNSCECRARARVSAMRAMCVSRVCAQCLRIVGHICAHALCAVCSALAPRVRTYASMHAHADKRALAIERMHMPAYAHSQRHARRQPHVPRQSHASKCTVMLTGTRI